MKDSIEIATIIKRNGGNLFLVGGAVRDELLGKKVHDTDYCVTGISEEKFKTLFPEAFYRGKAFGIFDIGRREFALARRERKTGTGHKEFEIETNEKITIEEDLFRRDITINAMAKDVLTGEIIDPYGGKSDLEKRVIRAVSEHFKEDPLRVYRVARFASGLEFKTEEDTIKMMNSLKEELNTISVERVYEELAKALLTSRPSIFFEALKKSDVLDVHFKEVNDLIGAEQPVKYHLEGDAFNHTMIVLDRAAKLTKDYDDTRKLEIRFGALCHDLGKGATPKEEYPHHYMHETTGVDRVCEMGNRLKLPTRLIKCGKTASKEHMRGGIFYDMKPSTKVEFIERVYKSILGLDGLQIIVKSDKPEAKEFERLGKKCMEVINGEYVKQKYGIQDGIELGKRLHEERVSWIKRNI